MKLLEKKQTYFNYIGTVELPIDIAKLCNHPGDCNEDVKRYLELPEILTEMSKINPESLYKELYDYGAWTEEELSNHSENLNRILWIAAGQILDEYPTAKFNKGDRVIYTNPQGVCFDERIVLRAEFWERDYDNHWRYYISDSDTPWYPVSENCLSLIKK